MGAPTLHGGRQHTIFSKISQKLHEIERIWTPGVCVPCVPPLRSATGFDPWEWCYHCHRHLQGVTRDLIDPYPLGPNSRQFSLQFWGNFLGVIPKGSGAPTTSDNPWSWPSVRLICIHGSREHLCPLPPLKRSNSTPRSLTPSPPTTCISCFWSIIMKEWKKNNLFIPDRDILWDADDLWIQDHILTVTRVPKLLFTQLITLVRVTTNSPRKYSILRIPHWPTTQLPLYPTTPTYSLDPFTP